MVTPSGPGAGRLLYLRRLNFEFSISEVPFFG